MDDPPRYRYQKATFAVHLPYYSFGRSLHFPYILHSFRRSMGRTPSLQTPESYFRRKSSPYSFRRGKPDIIQQAEDRILPLEPRAASLFSLLDFYQRTLMCRKFIKKHRTSAPTSVSGIHPAPRVNPTDFCTQCHKGYNPPYSFGRSASFPQNPYSFGRSNGRSPSLQIPESHLRRTPSLLLLWKECRFPAFSTLLPKE